MSKNFLLNKYNIFFVAVILYLALSLFFYYQTRSYAINKASEKIEEVLLNTQALRKFVSIQKNEVYRLQDNGEIDKDYFSPILLSSTYVSKQVNNIYNNLRNDRDKDAITIRFAAPNPRNDANEASEKEKLLLEKFNAKTLDHYQELIDTDRGKAIYYATPTRVTTPDCAICHTDPHLAPQGLVAMYGDTKGFYEHNGDIRALLSTTYLIKNDLKDAQLLFYLLCVATFIVLFALVLITYKYINIIKQKQKQLEEVNKNLESKVWQQTREITDKNEYLDLILNSSPNVIVVSDIEKIIYANKSFFDTFTAFSCIEEFNAQTTFNRFIHSHYCSKSICNLDDLNASSIDNSAWLQLFLNRSQRLCFKDDASMRYYTMSTTQFNHQESKQYLHIITDISELERAKIRLEELSIKDDLTKLYNRRYFNTVYERELKRATREESYFVFAIMDIDYFKNYNDALGHIKGDIALQKVAQAMQEYFNRSGDFIFRMGGEEFSVLFTTKELDSVKKHFIHFHKHIKTLALKHPNSKVSPYITLSSGVYGAKVDTLRIDFYKEADALLYKAKRKRDSAVFNF